MVTGWPEITALRNAGTTRNKAAVAVDTGDFRGCYTMPIGNASPREDAVRDLLVTPFSLADVIISEVGPVCANQFSLSKLPVLHSLDYVLRLMLNNLYSTDWCGSQPMHQ